MKMKFMIPMFVLTLSVAAHAATATLPDACGKDSIQFKVKTGKKNTELAPPEAGQALIIFTESVDGDFASEPVARFGIDGSWVGANKGASYFTVPVTPGQHHLCAVRQSAAKSDKVDVGEFTLNAQAGNIYYYDFKITRTPIGSPQEHGGGGVPGSPPHDMTTRVQDTMDTVSFTALNENDGRHRVNVSSLSTFTAKP